MIEREFNVLDRVNRSSYLSGGGTPGYESYHFVVDLGESRVALTEYSAYKGKVVEIQVRTILQHAWAEIEHDIQYKSVDELPAEIGQRFMELAGIIAISDREFQAIANAHEVVVRAAEKSIDAGRLSEVELTPETLKRYLDKKYGRDGRMRDWSYSWTTRLLKQLGFRNLAQLNECVKDYDDDQVSRAAHGSRQGQLRSLGARRNGINGPRQLDRQAPLRERSQCGVVRGGVWSEVREPYRRGHRHRELPPGRVIPLRDLCREHNLRPRVAGAGRRRGRSVLAYESPVMIEQAHASQGATSSRSTMDESPSHSLSSA